MARRDVQAGTRRRRGAGTLPPRLRASASLRDLLWVLDPMRPSAERLRPAGHDRGRALELLVAALGDAAERP